MAAPGNAAAHSIESIRLISFLVSLNRTVRVGTLLTQIQMADIFFKRSAQ
jgi:hypothetical protein